MRRFRKKRRSGAPLRGASAVSIPQALGKGNSLEDETASDSVFSHSRPLFLAVNRQKLIDHAFGT